MPNDVHPLTLTLSRKGRGNGQTAIDPDWQFANTFRGSFVGRSQ
jgi:hypothetical protein